MDRGDSPTELSINDLELWLECQARTTGHPYMGGVGDHSGHFGSQ